jgi:hypothetical protein
MTRGAGDNTKLPVTCFAAFAALQIMAPVADKKTLDRRDHLMISMSLGRYDCFIMSGFSFELTHA